MHIRDTRSKIYTIGNLTFWADKGLIHIENNRTFDYNVCSFEEWTARLRALVDQVSHEQYADDRNELILRLEKMQQCGRDAWRQGEPFADDVIRYLRDEDKKRRQISVPNVGVGDVVSR